MTNTLNPILLNWGIINIRWYGLFLALGVILAVWIIYKLFKQKNYPTNLALDLCTWLIIGGLIGARLGEILFYEPAYYFSHPLEIIFINHGGLSSHGMTIGLLLTLLLFSKINHHTKTDPSDNFGVVVKKISIKEYLDILIIPIPLLAMFIRLGNFFNSEIVGRATSLSWGAYFPRYEINPILRHPTQLYEAIISLSLFISIYLIYQKKKSLPNLFIFHLFLILYFGSRFLIEFTKEYQTSWEGFLTAGQWLSIPFVLWSIYWFLKNKKIFRT